MRGEPEVSDEEYYSRKPYEVTLAGVRTDLVPKRHFELSFRFASERKCDSFASLAKGMFSLAEAKMGRVSTPEDVNTFNIVYRIREFYRFERLKVIVKKGGAMTDVAHLKPPGDTIHPAEPTKAMLDEAQAHNAAVRLSLEESRAIMPGEALGSREYWTTLGIDVENQRPIAVFRRYSHKHQRQMSSYPVFRHPKTIELWEEMKRRHGL